jgi:zinc protease
VVAGDFDPSLIKPMVNDLFGSLPSGNVSPQQVFSTPRLATVVRTTTLDKVQLPAVMLSYHSPAVFAEGDAEMSIAGSVLADGNGSRLYQRLVVKEELASEVSASQDSASLSSIFRITVLCNPGADLGKVEAIVEEEIAALASNGPTSDELERSRAKFELDIVSSIQSIEARADRLNQYEYSFGTPDGLQRDLNRFREATPQGVRSWVNAVLRSEGKLVQRVLPEEPQRGPSARDTRPAAAPTAPFTPPTPESFALANGLKVMVLPRAGLPMVTMSLLSKSQGPVDVPEKAGRGAMMSAMIEEGPQGMTSKQFADEMALIGASFGASASQETASASMTVLKRGLDRGAALFAGAIRQPRMDSADFERVKNIHIDGLRQADDNPAAVASRVASRMLFGKTNPYGTPAAGTLATAESVMLSDAQAAYARAFRPEQSTLVFSGDVTKEEATALAEQHFASWTAGNSGTPTSAVSYAVPESNRAGMRVYIVDRPDAVQTVLHLRAPGIAYSDADRTRLELVNTVLGGSFTSRLNMNLREKNGYTYGARSGMIINPSLGIFSASTSVKAEQTGAALAEFLREIRGIREGNITPEEAAKARETVKSQAVGVFGTASDAAGAAVELAMHGAPWSTIAEDIKAYDACDAAMLNAACGRIVDLDRSVLVLVGDKGMVAEQIKSLELPAPVVVDASGESVR